MLNRWSEGGGAAQLYQPPILMLGSTSFIQGLILKCVQNKKKIYLSWYELFQHVLFNVTNVVILQTDPVISPPGYF